MSDFGIIDKRDLVKMTGIPASVGVCEPIEGFAERPDLILGCMKEMADKLTAARDEAERLRDRAAELESGLRTITSYPDVREYVGTICHDAALSALGGGGVGDAWLLRKQAEAVEKFGQEIGVFDPEYDDQEYVEIPRREVKAYAQRLRQQADEAEQ